MSVSPLLFKYKGNCCADCGLSADEMLQRFGVINKLFQFHHVDPDKKHPNYDNLIQRRVSAEQLDEIDKCVLLCNNCHDIIEAQKGSGTINFTFDLGDRTVVVPAKGQFLVDLDIENDTIKAIKARFFQDEPLYLDLYDVSHSNGQSKTYVGAELTTANKLMEFILRTQRTGILLIRPHGKPGIMLKATKLSERRCRVSASAQFPLITFNGLHDDGKLHLSVRNGQVIYNPKGTPPEVKPTKSLAGYTFHITYTEIRQKLRGRKHKPNAV
jgi:hypothetical protein